MSHATLRPATRDDLGALWGAFTEIIAAGETYVQDSTMTESEFQAYWWGRGGEQWVAEHAGRVLGGYTLRANYPGRGAHVGTASYVVTREARGQGIGRLLGEHSMQRASAMGFAAVQFNFVVSTNTAAIRLWESLGFRVLARLPGVFDHAKLGRTDALVMFRELDRAGSGTAGTS
jgi:ribosomal protein S18 acetylase RimI-like enzyme